MYQLTIFYLKNELKTLRTIIISCFFLVITLLIAFNMTDESFVTLPDGSSYATNLIMSIHILTGFICSSVLFSGILANDIENRNLRFMTPYISRNKIFLTKYFVMMVYFCLVFLASLSLLVLIKGGIPINGQFLFNLLVTYAYTEAVILFISSASRSEKTSGLLSTLASFIFPAIGITAQYFPDKKWLQILQWATPYPYLQSGIEILYLSVATLVLVGLGLYWFNRREI